MPNASENASAIAIVNMPPRTTSLECVPECRPTISPRVVIIPEVKPKLNPIFNECFSFMVMILHRARLKKFRTLHAGRYLAAPNLLQSIVKTIIRSNSHFEAVFAYAIVLYGLISFHVRAECSMYGSASKRLLNRWSPSKCAGLSLIP